MIMYSGWNFLRISTTASSVEGLFPLKCTLTCSNTLKRLASLGKIVPASPMLSSCGVEEEKEGALYRTCD